MSFRKVVPSRPGLGKMRMLSGRVPGTDCERGNHPDDRPSRVHCLSLAFSISKNHLHMLKKLRRKCKQMNYKPKYCCRFQGWGGNANKWITSLNIVVNFVNISKSLYLKENIIFWTTPCHQPETRTSFSLKKISPSPLPVYVHCLPAQNRNALLFKLVFVVK